MGKIGNEAIDIKRRHLKRELAKEKPDKEVIARIRQSIERNKNYAKMMGRIHRKNKMRKNRRRK